VLTCLAFGAAPRGWVPSAVWIAGVGRMCGTSRKHDNEGNN
jgi:hypothetical protein